MNGYTMDDISILSDAKNFSFSAENPRGEKNGGTRGTPVDKLRPCISVKPGETLTLVDTDGPGKIESMWFGGYSGPDFIFRIYWDNESEPSVESPLSAFFAYAFYNNVTDKHDNFPTLNSAAVLVAPCRGLSCYWRMPFRRHCRMTLENRNPSHERVTYYQVTGEYTSLPENSAYFCASYRQSRPVPRDKEYTVLDIKGKGSFAGVSLAVTLGGTNQCWVEGETKMYIDGDTYPSINYTGMEDYFCGSYCFGKDIEAMNKVQPFSGLYAGMFAEFGQNGNYSSWRSGERYALLPRYMAYRWHIPDPIRFEKDFRMTLQSIEFSDYGNRMRRDDFATVAYWYQDSPKVILPALPEPSELDFM